MNLYILNDVLYDYTAGMAVIAAESRDAARAIFVEEFPSSGSGEDFDTAHWQVIEGVNHPAGVVSYVYGGG
jgi:hypothetical protein